MTQALLAQGAVVTFSGDAVPEVTNFDFGQGAEDLDVTSHDSPNSTREFIAALITPDEIPMAVNWNWTDHNSLFAIIGDSSAVDTLAWELTDGANLSVQAYVKSIQVHVPATGAALTADIVWRTTGAIVYGS